MSVRIVSRERQVTVCERCRVADTVLARLRGLLGRSPLQPGEGIVLRPASAIHTMFMRFPVDAVFLDRTGRVLAVRQRLSPWRFAATRGARIVVELAADESRRRHVVVGEHLVAVP